MIEERTVTKKMGRPYKADAINRIGKVIYVWVEEDLKESLLNRAIAEQKSMSNLVREIIKEYLK